MPSSRDNSTKRTGPAQEGGRRAGSLPHGVDAGEARQVQREHYGAIVAVLVGYVFCRLFSYRVVDALGYLGGHSRPGDSVVGAVFGAIPLAVLTVYAAFRVGGLDINRRWFKVIATVGWLFAGGVMGVLPYSRFGTETNLVQKERATTPGFLHALDVTVGVGLVVVVALLLVSLRAHPRDRSVR
jgi:hypothetical protein